MVTGYFLRRLLGLVPTLLLITLVTFLMVRLAPGDPLTFYAAGDVDPRELAHLARQWGLDEPLPVQYWRWTSNFLRGDLGHSYMYNQPVGQLLAQYLPASTLLAGAALLLSLALGILLGLAAAVRPGGTVDKVVSGFSLAGLSLPTFWLGLLAIWLFSVRLGWLPSFGMSDVAVTTGWRGALSAGRHLLMPAGVLALAGAASYSRYVRASLLEQSQADYLRTARAQGLSPWAVLYRHGLKNALLPLVTVVAMDLPLLLSGALVTEQIFGWPGLGWFTWQSLLRRDYPVIMGALALAALFTMGSNLLADLAYRLLDPRVGYD